MVPESFIRRESQAKGLSAEQKSTRAQLLLKIIEYQEMFNVSHTLFGFTLGSIGIPLNDRFVFDLKKKYFIIGELFFSKLLEKDTITLIVIDAIETFRTTQGSVANKQSHMLETITYSIEETMINPVYIHEKWMNEVTIAEENRANEKAFKQFLEQEADQNKRKAEEADVEGWECPICICEVDKSDFGILECSHIFHPQCIREYLKTKIEVGETDIICPLEECGKVLEVGDIIQYSDPDLKEKFQKFTFNKFVEKDGSTTWCPTAGCSAAFEFEEGLDNYHCPSCKKHYCLKCRCVYHEGMTCAEYKINNTFSKDDEDFLKFVRGAKFKQCPKCNYWVERAEGCSTMACKCGQEFCYVCGGTTCPHGMCAHPPGGKPPPVRAVPRPMPVRLVGGKKRK